MPVSRSSSEMVATGPLGFTAFTIVPMAEYTLMLAISASLVAVTMLPWLVIAVFVAATLSTPVVVLP